MAALLAGSSGCGFAGPSCIDEQGTVLIDNGVAAAGQVATITVRSPKHSNLVMRLRWDPGAPRLGLRATITDCGGHTGCAMLTSTPSIGPGGPTPTIQPWPPGYVEMLVDGWAGKTYRVEIVGADREVAYQLEVLYRITCES
jgi:hypothetical protein